MIIEGPNKSSIKQISLSNFHKFVYVITDDGIVSTYNIEFKIDSNASKSNKEFKILPEYKELVLVKE